MGRLRGRHLVAGAGLLAAGLVLVFLVLVVLRSRLEAPAPSVLLKDRHGRFLGEVAPAAGGASVDDDAGFGYWPVGELPERVAAATLAVEDRRFWTHPGVDVLGIGRALVQNFQQGERVSGASTLAMQVARMQRPGARSYPRKALEAAAALLLTARHGREAVLEHYLRIVPYGNRIHGIRYAARRYLDKPVEDLSWAEVAFLTAIPQAPARSNPFDPLGRRRAIERGRRILDLLASEGHLSPTEHELARQQIETIRIPPRERRPESALHAVLYLGEQLSQSVTRPGLEAWLEEHPLVTTSLDLDLQEEISWQVLRAVDTWELQGAGNAAAAVVDRETSQVLAWVGSAGYFDERRAGAIDYGRVPRSPGSTLKPFLYALALERGLITPATVLDDLDRGAGGIGNADLRFLGPMLPRAALGNSRNVPAVNLLGEVGLDEAYGLLGDLGLHEGRVPARHYGFGLAIGSMPVTLEHLLGAYTALAGDGRRQPLVWYEGQESERPRRVLSESTARQLALFLSDPQARLPSFPRMGHTEYPFPVAVKTGTSSHYRDAWAVAFTRRYLVAAWVGHPDQRPMNAVSGYRSAAQLVHGIVNHLHRDQLGGLEDVGFPPPRGFHAVRLCALTGQRATAACDRVTLEWLRPGTEPMSDCTAHVPLAVDRRNGLLATAETPRQEVEVRTFTELPPRYASWSLAEGLPRPPTAVSDLQPGAVAALQRFPGGAIPAVRRTGPVRLSIVSPQDGLRLMRDPETPESRASLALKAVVDPPVEQVLWYVDGRPYRLADHPYTLRWPLEPGEHTFQVRVPYQEGASRVVRVVVQ